MDLNAVRMFVKTAEAKGFTPAAAALRMTQSGLSRAVSRLEADLGVLLLHRTTRSVSLTPDGELFYRRCADLLAEFNDAEQQLADRRGYPVGTLRLSAPIAFGRLVLRPLITRLCREHPGLRIDVSFTDRMVDMAEEGFDAAIRVGDVLEPNLIVRQLGILRLATVASPAYIAQFGSPQTPEDLLTHNCLTNRFPRTGKMYEWAFAEKGEVRRLALTGNLICDATEPLVEAAIEGQGIVQTARFMCERALDNGELVELLTPYVACRGPISLIYRRSRQQSQKLSVLLNALVSSSLTSGSAW